MRPGETIAFKVSVEAGPSTYRASLVRLFNVDSHRDGPGLQERPVPAPFAGEHRGRRQEIPNGSWVRFPAHPLLEGLGSFSLEVTLWPTAPGRGRQVLAATLAPDGTQGFALELDETGALALRLGSWTVSTGVPLLEREWAAAGASYDAGSGTVRLWQRPRRRYPLRDSTAEIGAKAPRGWRSGGLFSLAACRASAGMTAHYNGKLEAPRLSGAGNLIGAWDFAHDIATEGVSDRSPNGIHGTTVNLPLRAMTGAAWTGEWHDWRAQPAHYAAIHFHDDDLADCGWETDFTYTVPPDLPSGALRRAPGERPGRRACRLLRPPAAGQPRLRRRLRRLDRDLHGLWQLPGDEPLHLYEMYLGRAAGAGAERPLPEHAPAVRRLALLPRTATAAAMRSARACAPSSTCGPKPRSRPSTTTAILLGWLDAHRPDVDVITDEDLQREGAAAAGGLPRGA